jgi:orotate phosphoribosyltransferase
MASDLSELLKARAGHFRMESGLHSEHWVELGNLFAHEDKIRPFVEELTQRLEPHRPEAICGPMAGGAKLAALVGAGLGVESFHADRFDDPGATGLFPVRYLVPSSQRTRLRGRRVVIVDDAISAGSAVKGSHADLLACGAHPIACGALIVFGHAADQFSVQLNLALEYVARLPFNMWRPEDCPLCRSGVPLERVSDSS